MRSAHRIAYCKEYYKKWRVLNVNKVKAGAKKYRESHPESIKATRLKNRFRHALYSSKHFAAKFGYTACSAPEDEIKEAFTGQCDACGCPETKTVRLRMDHDHKTGQFRGWLCSQCNVALGMLGDSMNRITQLGAYLKRKYS